MYQSIPGTGFSGSGPVHPELSAKRKRGRPSKVDLSQGDSNLAVLFSGFDNKGTTKLNDAKTSDDMVGRVVSGTVEGSFDAGYFLTVRVGDTGTTLRGAVFQPGCYTPISEFNDVAPDARMYKRCRVPGPDWPPPTPTNAPIPQNDDRSVHFPSQNDDRSVHNGGLAPVASPLFVPSKFLPGASFMTAHKQPASLSTPENGLDLSLGKSTVPFQVFHSEPEALSHRQMAPGEGDIRRLPPKDGPETSFVIRKEIVSDRSCEQVIEEQNVMAIGDLGLAGGPEVDMKMGTDLNMGLVQHPSMELGKVVGGFEVSVQREGARVCGMEEGQDLNVDSEP